MTESAYVKLKARLVKHAEKHGVRSLELQREYLEQHPRATLPDPTLSFKATLEAYKFAIIKYKDSL